MSVTDITAPAIEPVDLGYIKRFLRVDTDDDDPVISALITSARVRIEQHISTSLIKRAQRYVTDCLSDTGLFINHGPVRVVNSVSYETVDGQSHILGPESYTVNLNAIPAKLTLNGPLRWESLGAQSVSVDMVAGYSETPHEIPMPLRQALCLLVAQSFEYRDKSTEPPLPFMVDALLMPYRSLKL